jgi:hypothetical protein
MGQTSGTIAITLILEQMSNMILWICEVGLACKNVKKSSALSALNSNFSIGVDIRSV